jgi:hypothetical protein
MWDKNFRDAVGLSDEETPYYAALGRFIAAYAKAEVAVHLVARKLSGLNDNVARVLFGGMRMGDITIRVKQMLKFAELSETQSIDIQNCLAQLDVISDKRHNLVHRGVSYVQGKGLSVDNKLTAKSLSIIEHDEFSMPDLNHLRTDSLCIFLRLMLFYEPEFLDLASPDFLKGAYLPWRYKPVSPPSETKRGHKTRQR